MSTEQQLHCRINSHRFDIRHRRTEESPVAEHFNGAGHTLAELTVVAIDQLYSHDVDQDPEDFTSFWNEPQSGFSVKPAR